TSRKGVLGEKRRYRQAAVSRRRSQTQSLQFGHVAYELPRVLQRRQCGADDAHFCNEWTLPPRQVGKLLRAYGDQSRKGHAALHATESEQCRTKRDKRRKRQGIN